LITQLYLEIKREMGKAILEGYSEDLSLQERFQTLWLNMLHRYMDHRQELAFMEPFDNSPYMNAEVQVAFAEQYEPLMRFFRVGFQEGVFKEMPLAMLSAFTAEVAVSLARHHAIRDLTLDDEAKELAMSATITEK
jgi:TetR/AcrR family transcriptional repressor of multidrug resistance operon